ncbi:MAG: hypothetical protein AAGL68_03680 [Pseudomonadota bacterium]
MKSDKVEVPSVVPAENWGRELGQIIERRAAEQAAKGGEFSMVPSGDVPIERILPFAKAVRAQPDVWGPCVVEAERRKFEVSDPDGELRRNEIVFEDTNPENCLLEWQRFINFRNWYLHRTGFYETDDPSSYANAQFMLRKWCRGDVLEDDDEAFVEWYQNVMPTAVDFGDGVQV